jgi:3-deoxy-D-arabino-heptulosonate 7-phosphate (DAHP) synthase
MLESYLKSGKQDCLGANIDLNPELSRTDACLGKTETEELLAWTYEKLS